MKKFPQISTKTFLSEISQKKELVVYKEPDELKEITKFSLKSYQKIVRNFLDPLTPYRNVLLFWGTGSGKTFGSLAIAESHNEYVRNLARYYPDSNMGIYIITKSIQASNQFTETIILPDFTGYKYISKKKYSKYLMLKNKFDEEMSEESYKDLSIFFNKIQKKILVPENYCYYKFMTYNTFGALINQKDFDYSNSLFIFDEAHTIEANTAEKTLLKIKENSENIKIILVSATPMLTNPSEVINILNFLRPIDSQLIPSDFFEEEKINEKDIKKLGELSRGYVSVVDIKNGLFPEKIEVGEIFSPFLQTHLIRCPTSDEHQKLLLKLIKQLKPKEIKEIVFPGKLSKNFPNIDFIFPTDSGMKFLNYENFEKYKKHSTIPYSNEEQINVPAPNHLFEITKLKKLSGKMYKMIDNILTSMKKDSGKLLVTHKFIFEGIFLIRAIFESNGFSIFPNKRNDKNAICYKCAKKYIQHKNANHDFKPAVVVIYTGSTTRIERKKILSVFNSEENYLGSNIKGIIGSSVIRESIDFNCIREIHIMSSQESLNMDKQIIGRGIRINSHKFLPPQDRNVKIYRYVSDFPQLKTIFGKKIYNPQEYTLFQQEKKFIRIQAIENELKRNAFDCPMNKYLNITKTSKLSRKKNKFDSEIKCISSIPKKLDTSTYNLINDNVEVQEHIKTIKYIFSMATSMSISKLIKTIIELNTEFNKGFSPFISEKNIYVALNKLKMSKEKFTNVYGIVGKIEWVDEIITFIPSSFKMSIPLENIYPKKASNLVNIDEILKSYSIKLNDEKFERIEDDFIKNISQPKIIQKKFNNFTLETRVKIVEKLIEKKSSILNFFPPTLRKYFISPENVSKTTKVFKIFTKNTHGKKDGIVGHIFEGVPKCYDFKNKKWGACYNMFEVSMPKKFVLDDYVGFEYVDKFGKLNFKIWINEYKNYADARKRRRGQDCEYYSISELHKIVTKFLNISEKKFMEAKNSKNGLCSLIREKIEEKNNKNKNVCFLSYYDYYFAKQKNKIDF